MKKLLTVLVLFTGLVSCSTNTEIMKPYVIEVVTFQYKSIVNATDFWKEDAKVEADYTGQQPGFISRESGYSENGNKVLVIVRWKSMADADASMKKFMNDTSVLDFANMIDAPTMRMVRYKVK